MNPADSTPRPALDEDCANCDGVRCMDCCTRTVHDDCQDDCPACCAPPTVPPGPGLVDLDDYSRALDEIFTLRALLAHEALELDATLGYRSFPRSRRAAAEASSARMKAAARGQAGTVARRKLALKAVGAPETLTRAAWEAAATDRP